MINDPRHFEGTATTMATQQTTNISNLNTPYQ